MKPETRDKIFQIEISLAIIIVLVTILSFFKPSITGFVPASIFTEQLNLEINKNTAFTIFSEQSAHLTSVRLSGEVVGNGKVHIYLSNMEGQNLLVYSNLINKEERKNLITGMATGSESFNEEERHSLIIQQIAEFNEDIEIPPEEGKIAEPGSFDNTCTETCSILMDLSDKSVYKLIVFIDGDALVKLSRISYSINEATE